MLFNGHRLSLNFHCGSLLFDFACPKILDMQHTGCEPDHLNNGGFVNKIKTGFPSVVQWKAFILSFNCSRSASLYHV